MEIRASVSASNSAEQATAEELDDEDSSSPAWAIGAGSEVARYRQVRTAAGRPTVHAVRKRNIGGGGKKYSAHPITRPGTPEAHAVAPALRLWSGLRGDISGDRRAA